MKAQPKKRGFSPTPEEIPEAPRLVPLTPEEQAIAARVAAQTDDDWHPIGEDGAIDYSLIGKDPFALPPPAKEMHDKKRYAFRWITRSPARIDEVRNKPMPFTWRICNRMTTPFLAAHVDPVLGCVCLEDQVLVYKPWSWFEAEQAYKRGLADAQTRSTELTGKHGQSAGESLSWEAGKRSLGSGKPLDSEVRGGDMVVLHETDNGFDAGDDGSMDGSE